jgi:alkylation response protein AidB-like acyl-CoA dehydrogenase
LDFRLTDDQLELQAGIEQFCAGVFPPDGLPAMERVGPAPEAWAALGELGLFKLRAPESDGGLGLGWVDTAVVYEVLGHHLVPGPLVWTQLVADVVPGAADGACAVTGLDLVSEPQPWLVEHPQLIGAVALLGPDGVAVVEATAFGELEPMEPLDPLTPVARLPVLPGGTAVGDATVADAMRVHGALLASALLVGMADRALALARTHALEREQFDRPIGSFQAVQHLLADMYVRTMLARSGTYGAAAALDEVGLDERVDDTATAAASAKVVAAEAAMANARACIQVHGGMGFTWEMMPHYLLKRAWVLEHSFGTTDRLTESIAAVLGSSQERER